MQLDRDTGIAQTLLDNISDSVCVLDAQFTPVYANNSGKALLERLAVLDSSGRLLRLGTLTAKELQLAADGSPIKLVADGSPPQIFEADITRLVDNGQTGSILLVLRNVTEEQENYVRAQEQNRLAAMGQLAAGIAHDFNKVLTAMIGYADIMMLNPDTTDRQKQNLEIISSQGRRAEQLVRQILDFSRQRSTRRTPQDVTSLMAEVEKLMSKTVPEAVTIKNLSPEEKLVVDANATQLQEVLTNLVVNARDAMPDGGTIEMGVKRIDIPDGARLMTRILEEEDTPPAGGSWIAITVRDTGTGIPPEIQQRIFEPFFTTKLPTKGTGLGLAQVYGIVRQHEGYVDLASEVGVGTTFTIYLPVSVHEVGEDRISVEEVVRGNGETILVVEDDGVVRRAVAVMLTEIGYDVVDAAGGSEAIAVLESEVKIDVLLTDVVMPGVDGVDVARKAKEVRSELPVVMMTGHTLAEREAIESMAAAFLDKPLSLDELSATINAQIASR